MAAGHQLYPVPVVHHRPAVVVLQRHEAFFGASDPVLLVPQVWRDEPFGIHQGLLADVVLRDHLEVGLGHLDAIPKHPVVPDHEGREVLVTNRHN